MSYSGWRQDEVVSDEARIYADEQRENESVGVGEDDGMSEEDVEDIISDAKKGLLWLLHDSRRRYEKLSRVHEATARHLREERRRRRNAEKTSAFWFRKSIELSEKLYGKGGSSNIVGTPAHYMGDGITCERAMESAASQKTVVPRSESASYWWRSAQKYLWRMWSKEDPVKDAKKVIDCTNKCIEHMEDE